MMLPEKLKQDLTKYLDGSAGVSKQQSYAVLVVAAAENSDPQTQQQQQQQQQEERDLRDDIETVVGSVQTWSLSDFMSSFRDEKKEEKEKARRCVLLVLLASTPSMVDTKGAKTKEVQAKKDDEKENEKIAEAVVAFCERHNCAGYVPMEATTTSSDTNVAEWRAAACKYGVRERRLLFFSLTQKEQETKNHLVLLPRHLFACVLIIAYQLVTFVRDMVTQLRRVEPGVRIYVIDNGSTFPPLIDWYRQQHEQQQQQQQEKPEEEQPRLFALVEKKHNHGHRVWEQHWRQFASSLSGLVAVTDPDLAFFTPELLGTSASRFDFLGTLNEVLHLRGLGWCDRAGLALDLDVKRKPLNPALRVQHRGILEWEGQFWKNPIALTDQEQEALRSPQMPSTTTTTTNKDEDDDDKNKDDDDKNSFNLPMYRAAIDTTFFLSHTSLLEKGLHPAKSIRVAGPLTCEHRPWSLGFESDLLPGELDSYKRHNISSSWIPH
jgi:hypothetical protein